MGVRNYGKPPKKIRGSGGPKPSSVRGKPSTASRGRDSHSLSTTPKRYNFSESQFVRKASQDLQRDIPQFRGLPRAQTRVARAGILGNLGTESMRFTALKGSNNAKGVGQWDPDTPRAAAFGSLGKKYGFGSYAANYGMLKHEMELPKYSGAIGRTLNAGKAGNIQDATGYFMGTAAVGKYRPLNRMSPGDAALGDNRYGSGFENPGVPNFSDRVKNANRYLPAVMAADKQTQRRKDMKFGMGANFLGTSANMRSRGMKPSSPRPSSLHSALPKLGLNIFGPLQTAAPHQVNRSPAASILSGAKRQKAPSRR